MKKITWLLIIIALFALYIGCSTTAVSTPKSSPAPKTQPQLSPGASPQNTAVVASITAKPAPVATPTVVTSPIARPAAGKSQEINFVLKAPDSTYSLVIFLNMGETLDLVWKFVANPQVGIDFKLTTPEGRELDSSLKPINLKGHPFYDQNQPDQSPEAAVGSSVIIKVGTDTYCNEGYYSLVFSGSHVQSGTVYMRYTLEPPATQ
jgi:hypothetical protein